MTYIVGEIVEERINVQDAGGEYIEPGNIFVTLVDPDGEETTYEPGSDHLDEIAVGRYLFSFTATKVGRYAWSIHTTGVGEGTGDGETYVRHALTAVARGLTLEELKRHMDRELDKDDDLLLLDLQAAFEQAQAPAPFGCGRRLVPDPWSSVDPPVAHVATARRRRILVPDAREIIEIVADGQEVTDYDVLRHQGHIVRITLPEQPNDAEVTVRGRFGFVSLPDVLRGAIYTLAARYAYERDAGYADQVVVGEGAAAQTYYRQLPTRAKLAFSTFTVPSGIAGLA